MLLSCLAHRRRPLLAPAPTPMSSNLRCTAAWVASVTHQILLLHPALGTRQFSVTYHPCAGADGTAFLCAMVLRDVTSEKLAHDSFVLYSQWREALNAIDRASLSDQSLPAIAAIALSACGT